MSQRITKHVSILMLCITILVAGCKEEKVKSRLSFDNNIEGSYWNPTGSITTSPQAHSGNYVCKINKDNAYSSAMNIRAREISNKPLKRLTVTAWFMLTGHGSEQNLVLDIRDSTNENSLEWLNIDAADFNSELNKWAKAELTVDLTQKGRNNINNYYRIYATNGRDEPVYVDDFEVSFED